MNVKMGKPLLTAAILQIGLLTACSATVEKEVEETKTSVKEAFESKPKKPTAESDSFSYYLPNEMEIESTSENNIILHQDEQIYILFINPNEQNNSEVMFNAIVDESKDSILNESYTDENRFGYVNVKEIEEKLYEVSVGIGGIKMTTESKIKNISENAAQMMNIVASVQHQES